MEREKLKKLLSFVISFVSAMCIVASGVLLAFCITFCEPVLAAVMKSDNYINSAEEEILFELRSYAGPGGLPDDFFSEGLDKEIMRADIKSLIKSATKHVPFEAETFKNEFREKVYAFAEGEGMDVEQTEIKEGIEKLLLCFETGYKTYMYSTPLRASGMVRQALFPLGTIGAVLSLLIGLALFFVVYKMNGAQNKLYFVSTFGGSSLMLFLVPLIILVSGTISKLNIHSHSIFYLVSTVIYILIWSLLAEGVLLAFFVLVKSLIKKSTV